MRQATLFDFFVLSMACYEGYRFRKRWNEMCRKDIEDKNWVGLLITIVGGAIVLKIDNEMVKSALGDIQLIK